jgi:opacity protein-like surface antigen
MKTLALLLVLAMATAAIPADWTKPKKSDGYKFEITECGKDCIQIKSKNNTIRYRSCGQVEKLVWKEINPNEDTLTYNGGTVTTDTILTWADSDSAFAIGYEDKKDAIRDCQNGVHKVDDYWVCD